jgi:hypothetical protein
MVSTIRTTADPATITRIDDYLTDDHFHPTVSRFGDPASCFHKKIRVPMRGGEYIGLVHALAFQKIYHALRSPQSELIVELRIGGSIGMTRDRDGRGMALADGVQNGRNHGGRLGIQDIPAFVEVKHKLNFRRG